MSSIQRIGILGSGQMGAGIAQTAAQADFEVILADQTLEIAQKGKDRILIQLRKQVEKGKLTELDVNNIQSKISVVGSLDAFKSCDLLIEAVSEKPDLKFDIFRKLDEVAPAHAILASNTSSISITGIAAVTRRPEKVIGMHFMNPVPVMKLVEGIRGLQCTDETAASVRTVAERMGKTFVEVRDIPGFVVNRILMPMINEAVQALYEGIASAEDIDTSMKLGTNQPMGPLALADFIGLDTCLAIMEVLHQGFADSKYRPSPLLRQYVTAGWLGKKSGRGFYRYDV